MSGKIDPSLGSVWRHRPDEKAAGLVWDGCRQHYRAMVFLQRDIGKEQWHLYDHNKKRIDTLTDREAVRLALQA